MTKGLDILLYSAIVSKSSQKLEVGMASITTCKTDNLTPEDFEGRVRTALYKHTIEIDLKDLEEKVVEHLKHEGIKAEVREIRQAIIQIIERGTFGVLQVTSDSHAERIDAFSASITFLF